MKSINDNTVSIKFSNKAAAKHFIIWLGEQGEQEYWDWMSDRESEEDGDITVINFDYALCTEDAKEFIINTECGRSNINR